MVNVYTKIILNKHNIHYLKVINVKLFNIKVIITEKS